MKILLVTWYFPPLNDVAAVRTGAMAEFLQQAGHEVRVVTAARAGDASMVVPLTDDRIVRTSWFDVDTLQLRSNRTASSTRNMPVSAAVRAPRKRPFARLRAVATNAYANLVHVPDRQIGWFAFALAAGRDVAARHGVDLIYASGPPFTTHRVARALSRKLVVPWIAEFRDGWSSYLYEPRPRWRQAIDKRMEAATVRSAAGVVAVTAPWADHYRMAYKKPTVAIYNGLPDRPDDSTESESAPEQPLSIAYLGVLYDGLRDPAALYEAIKRSALTPRDIQVVYYGPSEADVRPMAEKFGLEAYVAVKPRVSYTESLRVQRASDVLLLLQAPGDPRNVPAKLFEYLASGRPILGLGLDNGIPAKLIRDRSAGLYQSDPNALAEQLRKWSEEKHRAGRIPAVPSSAREGLSRSEQFEALERFLSQVKAQYPGSA